MKILKRINRIIEKHDNDRIGTNWFARLEDYERSNARYDYMQKRLEEQALVQVVKDLLTRIPRNARTMGYHRDTFPWTRTAQ